MKRRGGSPEKGVARGKVSAGVLVWRTTPPGLQPVANDLEVLVVHPGGPFFANKDAGAWSLPKGEVEQESIDTTALVETALRELLEETGLAPETDMVSLGSVTQKSGKIVHIFAMLADADLKPHRPPQVRLEWPPGSMRELAFPEVDKVEFTALESARVRLNPAQVVFLDRLLIVLGGQRWDAL